MTDKEPGEPTVYEGTVLGRRIALVKLPRSVTVSTSGAAGITPLGGGGRFARTVTETSDWKVWDVAGTEVTAATLTAAIDQLSSISGRPVNEILGTLQPMLVPPSGIALQSVPATSGASGALSQTVVSFPRCSRCSTTLPPNSRFCNQCGLQITG